MKTTFTIIFGLLIGITGKADFSEITCTEKVVDGQRMGKKTIIARSKYDSASWTVINTTWGKEEFKFPEIQDKCTFNVSSQNELISVGCYSDRIPVDGAYAAFQIEKNYYNGESNGFQMNTYFESISRDGKVYKSESTVNFTECSVK